MRRVLFLMLLLLPLYSFAQGNKRNKGTIHNCASIKQGKVCYSDQESIDGVSNDKLYQAIRQWAKDNYGKDYFISNMSEDKKNKSIFCSSKIELLINEKYSSVMKYKMYIKCFDNSYQVEINDIAYTYEIDGKQKSIPAEKIISKNGKANKISSIKDPEDFCNATFFFVEGVFSDIHNAAKSALKK